MACNLPILKAFDHGDEIPFPTAGASLTPTLEFDATPTVELGVSYLKSIQEPVTLQDGMYQYYAQSGDTLTAVARRFNVQPELIQSAVPIERLGLIPPRQLLFIPDVLGVIDDHPLLLPDSELIFSPGAEGFDIDHFIETQGGYLSGFQQQVEDELLSGAAIVERVARNTSVNPRLLLSVIEFRSGWVTTTPEKIDSLSPLGFYYSDYPGFYLECSLAAKWLNMGYYGWRKGDFTRLTFFDGSVVRIAPQSNAGTVALQYFLAQLDPREVWEASLYGPASLLSVYQRFFGDPWVLADSQEPIFKAGVLTPQLELPFSPGEEWALTGGLHVDWNSGTPSGALDFAPVTGEPRCSVSRAWVLASAAGVVTRSSDSIVAISITDQDSSFSGWQLFYMHIADVEQIPEGSKVNLDDPIGHPSCEGGLTTGTHVHFARKYNGEWIGAGDPFPLVLSGWTALPGEKQFQSSLVKGSDVVTAMQDGGMNSRIFR